MKKVSELNRMKIAVREWAMEKAIGDSWIGTNLVKPKNEEHWAGDEFVQNIVEIATKLEEYVVGGIKEEEVTD